MPNAATTLTLPDGREVSFSNYHQWPMIFELRCPEEFSTWKIPINGRVSRGYLIYAVTYEVFKRDSDNPLPAPEQILAMQKALHLAIRFRPTWWKLWGRRLRVLRWTPGSAGKALFGGMLPIYVYEDICEMCLVLDDEETYVPELNGLMVRACLDGLRPIVAPSRIEFLRRLLARRSKWLATWRTD
jgi:hypothetical protein